MSVKSLMNILYFSSWLVLSTQDDCDACIEDVCYQKSLLWSTGKIYGQQAIDRKTNTLYINIKTDNNEDRTVAVNIDTGEYKFMSDIKQYCPGRTIDQETQDYYYFCSVFGLYKYSPITNTTLYLGLSNVGSLNDIHYRNKVYYSKLLRGLCFYVDRVTSLCYKALESTPVDDFAFDKNNDLYYRSNAQFYRRRNNTFEEEEFLFTHRFIKLHLDTSNNIYFSLFDKIMKLNYETDEQIEVGVVKNANIYEGHFDRDNNLVYYDISGKGVIYKLIPTKERCTC